MKEPTKYWLSNLRESIGLRKLLDVAKLRWRIECDYEELKRELGPGHFEGLNWRGFHRHATLVVAAYGFPVQERCLSPLRNLPFPGCGYPVSLTQLVPVRHTGLRKGAIDGNNGDAAGTNGDVKCANVLQSTL